MAKKYLSIVVAFVFFAVTLYQGTSLAAHAPLARMARLSVNKQTIANYLHNDDVTYSYEMLGVSLEQRQTMMLAFLKDFLDETDGDKEPYLDIVETIVKSDHPLEMRKAAFEIMATHDVVRAFLLEDELLQQENSDHDLVAFIKQVMAPDKKTEADLRFESDTFATRKAVLQKTLELFNYYERSKDKYLPETQIIFTDIIYLLLRNAAAQNMAVNVENIYHKITEVNRRDPLLLIARACVDEVKNKNDLEIHDFLRIQQEALITLQIVNDGTGGLDELQGALLTDETLYVINFCRKNIEKEKRERFLAMLRIEAEALAYDMFSHVYNNPELLAQKRDPAVLRSAHLMINRELVFYSAMVRGFYPRQKNDSYFKDKEFLVNMFNETVIDMLDPESATDRSWFLSSLTTYLGDSVPTSAVFERFFSNNLTPQQTEILYKIIRVTATEKDRIKFADLLKNNSNIRIRNLARRELVELAPADNPDLIVERLLNGQTVDEKSVKYCANVTNKEDAYNNLYNAYIADNADLFILAAMVVVAPQRMAADIENILSILFKSNIDPEDALPIILAVPRNDILKLWRSYNKFDFLTLRGIWVNECTNIAVTDEYKEMVKGVFFNFLEDSDGDYNVPIGVLNDIAYFEDARIRDKIVDLLHTSAFLEDRRSALKYVMQYFSLDEIYRELALITSPDSLSTIETFMQDTDRFIGQSVAEVIMNEIGRTSLNQYAREKQILFALPFIVRLAMRFGKDAPEFSNAADYYGYSLAACDALLAECERLFENPAPFDEAHRVEITADPERSDKDAANNTAATLKSA
jgi:hypothetical protein